jgi:hypothetical protein
LRRLEPIKLKCSECSVEFERFKTTNNLSYCGVCIKRVVSRRYARSNRHKINAYRKRTLVRKRKAIELTCHRCSRSYVRKQSVGKYCKNCRRVFRKAKHRAAKGSGCPPWVDQAAIAVFYEIAKRITRCTGVKFEVDHIMPLQGKDSCGLHVPWNLRVTTAYINRSKGNRVQEPSNWQPKEAPTRAWTTLLRSRTSAAP